MDIKAIIFGATGHIGQGVLIECIEDPRVKEILIIGRRASGQDHSKIKEIIHSDYLDYQSVVEELKGYNACFFCLGISSMGKNEEQYHLITHDYALAAGEILCKLNPDMTFCFVSGAGTDDSLQSRMMWARVKGKTENSLKALSFKKVYLFRPGYIQPLKGVKSNYTMYKVLSPLYPVFRKLFPKMVSTTVEVGQAMINAVEKGYEKQTLESIDIVKLAARSMNQD